MAGVKAPVDVARAPAGQGFRWPAEWEPHAATWLAWPHKEASWPGRLEQIPPVFAEMIRLLAPGEPVRVNVVDQAMKAEIRDRLQRLGVAQSRVRYFQIPHDDAWIRDHGPIFLTRGAAGEAETAIVDWGYNAWGGKYPPYAQDDAVPGAIGVALGMPVFTADMILEGGSVEGDGQGTVLTTESCLLNPNRNPGKNRAGIERMLEDYLGARKVLWLGQGIAGDDTDGHVDDLTRFTSAHTVVTAVEEDATDVNYEPLRANLARLEAMRDADGRPLEVVPLPMPEPVAWEGQRLPASYANFYIGNEVVLMPAFGGPRDQQAARVLTRLFPGRRVAPINARELVWGLGAFHCLTQQQPWGGGA